MQQYFVWFLTLNDSIYSINVFISGEKCRDCMTRLPYATLIATVLCCAGVGIFLIGMYRGTTITELMFEEVFRIKTTW